MQNKVFTLEKRYRLLGMDTDIRIFCHWKITALEKYYFFQHETEDHQEYKVVANSFSEFLISFVSKGKTFVR
ncbi:hypothetical protein AV654_07750 [Paenibacillus elgii]|uniref:SMI1/KNR4 family protein n=1 Tax=Paenibacillus elgii TaxID=189691 RepID=A0A164AAP7_9BACL|nr:hypothetical protein AV654_07750 [Paenibacillus elgii]